MFVAIFITLCFFSFLADILKPRRRALKAG